MLAVGVGAFTLFLVRAFLAAEPFVTMVTSSV